MNDPRDVGLPPLEGAPAFSSDPQALGEVRRRYTRRRQRRMAVAGGGMAAVIVAIAVAFNPGGTTGALEQQQPAHPGGLLRPMPAASQQSAGADGGKTPTAPGAGGSGALNPSAPGQTGGGTSDHSSPGVGAAAAQDSTRVRRDRWSMSGQQYCRQLEKGWQALGWCFEAEYPSTFTAGRGTTMSISLCRNSSLGGQVRFPSAQQAVWSISQGGTRLWSSTEQPSYFRAGEVVDLPSLACLRWRVDWHVTTHGRPLPAGDYVLAWSTGADIRDAQGAGYHDSDVVHVA